MTALNIVSVLIFFSAMFVLRKDKMLMSLCTEKCAMQGSGKKTHENKV